MAVSEQPVCMAVSEQTLSSQSEQAVSDQPVCMRCGAPGAEHLAVVPHASIHARQCRHGPFCPRCAHRKEKHTLPLCQCLALISSWTPPLPPPPPRAPVLESTSIAGFSDAGEHDISDKAAEEDGSSPPRPWAEEEPAWRYDTESTAVPLDESSTAVPLDESSQPEQEVPDVIQRAMAAVDKLGGAANTARLRAALANAAKLSAGVASDPAQEQESEDPWFNHSEPLASERAPVEHMQVLAQERYAVPSFGADNQPQSPVPVPGQPTGLADSLAARGGRPRKNRKPKDDPWQFFTSWWTCS
eukprot:TRINITY_DN9256_c0_g1_i1.p1 TRINITY_DN9256_c0_g1~~TRINITY_DN9256_c0_g1_i1.p1  ORF type:complete len:309 (+),score=55.17 TRINITY_DN9256_c0_g1_i1:27-929(+)